MPAPRRRSRLSAVLRYVTIGPSTQNPPGRSSSCDRKQSVREDQSSAGVYTSLVNSLPVGKVCCRRDHRLSTAGHRECSHFSLKAFEGTDAVGVSVTFRLAQAACRDTIGGAPKSNNIRRERVVAVAVPQALCQRLSKTLRRVIGPRPIACELTPSWQGLQQKPLTQHNRAQGDFALLAESIRGYRCSRSHYHIPLGPGRLP